MTHIMKSALLVAALSAPLAGGIAPAAFGAEAAATTQPAATRFVTIKGDRGSATPTAQMILATIAAESDD